jgi:hypothetical protein
MFKIGDKVRGIGKHDFKNIDGYIGVIVARLCKNVPESNLELIEETDVKIIQKGLVVIAKRGENEGIARCNPADEFDLKTGIDLALKRLEEKENYGKPFVPETGNPYYSVSWTTLKRADEAIFMPDFFEDALMAALKATYHTREEAEEHADEIHAKMQKVLNYAKSL